jgi:endoglucanase
LSNSAWKRLLVSLAAVGLLAASVVPVGAKSAPPAGHSLATNTRFYVAPPDKGALTQIQQLVKAHDLRDAYLIGQMIVTPQSVWFTGGTPAEVRKSVGKTVTRAASMRSVPVLVAYNVPYRDCAQYSAGGAVNTAAYKAWIDGFAKGIGNRKVVVILEPDSLGIIPYYTPLYGSMEWCQPKVDGQPAPEAEPAYRFEQLNYAVDVLEALPNTSVYLDGTHSGWVGVGSMADRLIQAGVKRAQGFFTNVSNYRTTETSAAYGRWISQCIARTDMDAGWNPNWCPSQYNPATGYQLDYSPEYVASVDAQYAGWEVTPTAHFVIDTSRNGQGPWTPPADRPAGDAQDWCNPPDRGVGLRPTANTGVALLDAYVWVKIPGESDGQCTRWAPDGGIDPARGYADPAAGAWFPQMALELVTNANPAFKLPKFLH